MIRITVEILPRGCESEARHVGTIKISNDGSGTPELGNYIYRISKLGDTNTFVKRGEIKGFPRKRKNLWKLIQLVLNNYMEDENGDKRQE